MKSFGKPIADPTAIFGKELFYVTVNPVDNHTEGGKDPFQTTIGNILQYAAVDSVVVKEMKMNDTGTTIIVNPSTDNIRVPLDQSRVDVQAEGVYFDSNEKASAVEVVINETNLAKAEEFVAEGNKAKNFIKSLLERNTQVGK